MLTCNAKYAIVLYLFNLHCYPCPSASFAGRNCNTCSYAIKSHGQKYCITLFILINIIGMLELKTNNHQQHPSLYKEAVQWIASLTDFWSAGSVTFHTVCNMSGRDLPDMAVLTLRLMHTYQANPFCPCYIYNIQVKQTGANYKTLWIYH